MLDRGKRPWWSDEFESAVEPAPAELFRPGGQGRSGVTPGPDPDRYALPRARSRLVVALALIAAGVVWAIARGLHFYGLTPADIGYDLDQPPLVLMLVATWLLYRSRCR